MSDALSNSQFYTEQKMLGQGNLDDLATRVRGIQHMSSNVYRPSFSSDYSTVRSMRSPASAGQIEDQEDEEGE